MIRSDSLSELNTALSAAQGEFEAVAKTSDNPFFKSKFAPLPEVVKAATPILAKHGLAVWQGADTDETGELLWTVILHSSGQYIGSAARLLLVKNDPQAQGSATTYQRRYQYMAALGLVADEDDDGNSASGRAAGRSKPPSRAQSGGRGNAQTPPAQRPSGADDGSQEGSEPVTTETLEKIAKLTRAKGLKVPQWKALVAEVGAAGKKSTALTQDQAVWVVNKLEAMESAA